VPVPDGGACQAPVVRSAGAGAVPFRQACACPFELAGADGGLEAAGELDRRGEAKSREGVREGEVSKPYLVKKLSEVETVPCLCGSSTRPITIKDTPLVNLHVTHIQDSAKHYHKECTEIYLVLEGSGVLELGWPGSPEGEGQVKLEPGVVVLIHPGTSHRGRGDFRAVIVGVPAQKPEDEHLV